MSFNDNVTLDTSQVGRGGGGGAPGGLVVGGGLGGIVLLIIAMIFGIDPSSIPTGGGQLDPGQVQSGGQEGTAYATAFATLVLYVPETRLSIYNRTPPKLPKEK